jgi:hypothetical protein
LESNKPTRPAQKVVACAQDAGIRVADQFSFMQGIAAGGTNALRQYYMYRDNNYGHMSALGNWEAAHLLSTALQDWLEVLPATH